ncbi:MAG: FAD-dependent monooxygenase [Bauldia sp.]|nr:FAD-dependent monooxygenase [Bauldia sp.]
MSGDPILIVGAGPAGLVLAIELTRRGVACQIIDHRAPDLPQDRAAFVKSRSLEIFASYGLADAFLQRGHVINGFGFHSGGAEATSYRINTIDSPFPYFLGISESETENLLAGKLEQVGGAVERGVKLVDHHEESDGLVARLSTVSGDHTRKFGWIVGADGLHSTVRQAAGIPFPGHDYPLRWGVVDGRLANWSHAGDMVAVQFSPLIYAAPVGTGRRRIYFRADPDAEAGVAAVNRMIAALGPGVELRDADTPQLFHSHCKVAPTFRSGRVLLTGDAAHAISPTQAHGMNTGIQDSFNLGWKLALVAKGLAPESLLDTYDAERRPVAELVAKTGDDAESFVARGDPEAIETITRVLSDSEQRHQMATDEAEVAYVYGGSPIVENVGAPTAASGATEAGCRVGDASGLVTGNGSETKTLHEVISHVGHTVFLLAGDADQEQIEDGLALIRAATDRYGGHLKAYLVHTNEIETKPEVPELLFDRAGAAHARLGPAGNSLAVVRPDGHLGLRCVPPSPAALDRYLSNTFA